MVDRPRVLIDADGTVKVSSPGFSVLTAGLDEMSYDSRFASIGQSIIGERIIQRREHSGQAGKQTTIPFGRVFDTAPMFLFGWTLRYQPTRFNIPKISGFHPSPSYQFQVDAQVEVNRVTFVNYIYPFVFPNNDLNTTTTVRWKAFA